MLGKFLLKRSGPGPSITVLIGLWTRYTILQLHFLLGRKDIISIASPSLHTKCDFKILSFLFHSTHAQLEFYIWSLLVLITLHVVFKLANCNHFGLVIQMLLHKQSNGIPALRQISCHSSYIGRIGYSNQQIAYKQVCGWFKTLRNQGYRHLSGSKVMQRIEGPEWGHMYMQYNSLRTGLPILDNHYCDFIEWPHSQNCIWIEMLEAKVMLHYSL